MSPYLCGRCMNEVQSLKIGCLSFTDVTQGQAHGTVSLQATAEGEHTIWENCGSKAKLPLSWTSVNNKLIPCYSTSDFLQRGCLTTG